MDRRTVKDIGNYKRKKPRRRGVRVDFRWSVNLTQEERLSFLEELEKAIRELGLIMSGFGEESYSGIISAAESSSVLKKKVGRLSEWSRLNSEKFNLFRMGKIQWVEDIYFE